MIVQFFLSSNFANSKNFSLILYESKHSVILSEFPSFNMMLKNAFSISVISFSAVQFIFFSLRLLFHSLAFNYFSLALVINSLYLSDFIEIFSCHFHNTRNYALKISEWLKVFSFQTCQM